MFSGLLINTNLSRNTHKHVSIFKVVSPVRPYLPLASNVPDIQFEALRLHALNVKALASTEELKAEAFKRLLYETMIINFPTFYKDICNFCNREIISSSYFLCVTCVGVMLLISSEASCLRSVVFPPLSNPRSRMRTSWSGALFSFLRIDNKPWNKHNRTR